MSKVYRLYSYTAHYDDYEESEIAMYSNPDAALAHFNALKKRGWRVEHDKDYFAWARWVRGWGKQHGICIVEYDVLDEYTPNVKDCTLLLAP